MRRVLRSEFVIPCCTEACPAGVDVPRYIRAVRDRKYDEAVAILREKIPFPSICADACFAPCEEVCAYRQFGEPIAIRAIKRAAVERGEDIWKERKKIQEKTGRKVAVVGAGPSGLTAAYYLRGKGHDVTVLDAFSRPGGTMRYGIPRYRLPEDILDKEIRMILNFGVIFKGNTTIGVDITPDQLSMDYDAVFLAAGAGRSVKIPLEGAEKSGVLWGLDFLREISLGKSIRFSGPVIVVGGGNVAIDVALTAKRMGAKAVHLFCLEKREEMPAHQWEIARAEEEGVVIHNSWGPKKVLGSAAARGLQLVKCMTVFDADGKFNPLYDEGITERMDAEDIILAVGQSVDTGFLKKDENIRTIGGCIEVDENLATGKKGIFAGGDLVSGPGSIIQAISYGRRAAKTIDQFLGGDGNIDEILAIPEDEVSLPDFIPEVKPRNEMALLKPWQRAGVFDQVELGFTDEQITAESNRCLNCDARSFEVRVNMEYCKECGYCAEVCKVDTFGPADFFNVKGYRPMECKSSERCVGCFKCYFACPDFAIDVKEVTG